MTVAAEHGRRPWEPFGVSEADFAAAPERDGIRVVNVTPGGKGPGQAGWWLAGAAVALTVLAAAAAVVSWDAQYTMVAAAKASAGKVVAALEAGIPDTGAVVFAALGVALALHGKRALRPRALNAVCIGISLAMNALAAGPGWRGMAIWVMPAGVYALASDTLIGVVRAWVLARARHSGERLTEDGPTPLALVGSAMLWLLRLALAPRSTLSGFRGWVVTDCPAAPGLRPGHLAELTAIRQEAEERIALTAAQRDEAIERAAAEASQARSETTRAQTAEAAARAELERVRADASQAAAQASAEAARERDELRTWSENQITSLRGEVQRVREDAARVLGEVQDAAARVAALEEARSELRARAEYAEREAGALRAECGRLTARLQVTAAAPGSGTSRSASPRRPRAMGSGEPTKRDRMIALASGRHDLAALPQGEVSALATGLAAEIGYSAGTARRELLRHVRQLQSVTADSAQAADAPAAREAVQDPKEAREDA